MSSDTLNQPDLFVSVVEAFKNDLTDEEKDKFKTTTLQDLHIEIENIQRNHASKRKLQGMRRLQRFLEAMNDYDKVISVFTNTSTILAFVWVTTQYTCALITANHMQ
jgi:transcriptional/translational regulatory protein YebC/TACO1